jgi:type I restriction enzyme S subunit
MDSCLGAIIAEGQAELQTGPFGTMLKAEEYSNEGAPVISVGEIREGYLVIGSKTPRISDETIARLPRFLLRQNDIVFGRKGSTHRNALIKKDEEGFFLGSDGIRLRVNSESICPKYLSYQLRSARAVSWLKANSEGTTMPSLNQDILSRFPITLLPVADQKAIAHILGTLDDKIALNRKTNETLEAMAKALFKSWFVDFDPVRAKAEGCPTGLPAEISELFPDSFEDTELGEIPSGWRVTPVGDVVECVGGSTPSTSEADYWDGGEYFWATPKDLSSLSEPFLLDTAKKITADGVQRISSGILPVGTVLLSSRAPVGYVAAACVPVSINQGFIALKSNGLMSSAYLLNWCLSNVQQFKDRASGTTFAEISKAAFRPIPLLVPSEQVARSFSDKAQALYERVVSNMRQSTLLAATRDALLPKLISGEIRITDAEKMLEEVGV